MKTNEYMIETEKGCSLYTDREEMEKQVKALKQAEATFIVYALVRVIRYDEVKSYT